MRGWLLVGGVVFGGFGVWVGSAGFVLFGLMLFIFGVFAYIASSAASSLGEKEE